MPISGGLTQRYRNDTLVWRSDDGRRPVTDLLVTLQDREHLPIIIFWDGIVSMLRIYSPEQMIEPTRDLQRPSYRWEIGRLHVRGGPGKLPYLIGRDTSKAA